MPAKASPATTQMHTCLYDPHATASFYTKRLEVKLLANTAGRR